MKSFEVVIRPELMGSVPGYTHQLAHMINPSDIFQISFPGKEGFELDV